MRTRWGGLLAAFWMSASLCAQVRVTGRVVNDTNAPITNAVVQVRTAGDTSPPARGLTDRSGVFTLELAQPGEYLLDASAVGHYGLKNYRITAAAGGNEIAITLVPAREFADSVDVTAAPGSLALDQTAPEQTLTGAQMLDIPVPVTHDLKAMMRVLPGVVQDNSNRVHLNGGAENQTLYLLDGFNIGDPLTGNFETRLTMEGIQSMNVETGSLSPEYGKGSAGVIAVNMKTGDDRLRYSATNFIPGLENNKGLRIGSYYPRLNLSGPLKKGRVWFSDSLASQYAETIIRELPPGQDKATSIRYNNFLHVQANITPANIATFGFLGGIWTGARTGLGALDPPSTTVDRRARQWFAYAKDQLYFGHGAVAEFGLASNRTFSREVPHGSDLYVFTPFGREGNYYVNGIQQSSRDQAIASVYLPSFTWLGSHQLKVGADVDWLDYGQKLSRTGYEWLDASMLPVRRVLFEGNGDVGRHNLESAGFVQDSWRLRPNVLFEVGLRSDWDRLVEQWTWAPRAGIAWSPARFEDTRVSAGYSISYDATDLSLFTRPIDQHSVTYYFPPYGIADQPVQSRFVITNGRALQRQRFTTWNGAIDHRFGSGTFVRLQVVRRRGSNGLTYSGPSELSTISDMVYRLTNSRGDSYDAVELTVRQNFRKEYGWMASYTRSRARSTAVVDLASDTPLLVSQNAGRLGWDAPDRFVGWAYVPTPWRDWAVAASVEYHTGFPFSVENSAGAVLGPVNESRYPDFFELNLHVERRFQFHGQRWAGRAGYNNITGHLNPNVVNNIIDAPKFLSFYGGQARALQFRIRWLGKL